MKGCGGERAGVEKGVIDVCESEGEDTREEKGEALREVVVPIVSAVEDS